MCYSLMFASFLFSFMPHSKPSVLFSFHLAWHAKIQAGEALPSLSPGLLCGVGADRTPPPEWLDRVEGEGNPPSSTRFSRVGSEENPSFSSRTSRVESKGNSLSSTCFGRVESKGHSSCATWFNRVGSERNHSSCTQFG